MRLSCARLVVAGVVLATAAAALPVRAATSPAPVRRAPLLTVSGHVQPLPSYLARGLSPRHALLAAALDRLAAQGLDPAMLTRAAASSEATASGGSAPEPGVFLSSGGNLDGRGVQEVLEQRFLPSGTSTQVVQLVVRDGATGRLLWTRKDSLPSGDVQFAVPAHVGRGGRPGLVLLRYVENGNGFATVLTAVDGTGRQLWTRRLGHDSAWGGAAGPSLGYSSGFGYQFTSVELDVRLRPGAFDVVETYETYAEAQRNGVTSRSGTLRLTAISGLDGSARALPGSVASKDGQATGGVVGDQDGDGLADLVAVDAGSAHRVTVVRAVDGRSVWQRTDVVTHTFTYVTPAGRLSRAAAHGRPVDDLVLVTGADPGLTGAGGVDTPVAFVPDPTAADHGQVLLLAGGTGRTVLSKAGDDAYLIGRAGVPALGVVTDSSSAGPTAYVADIRLDVYDVAGRTRWQQEHRLSVPRSSPDEWYFLGGFAAALSDLDGDGGDEGVVVLYVDTESGDHEQVFVVRSSDGAAMRDTSSDFLFAGLTRKGQDRVRVTASGAGLLVEGLRGRDSARLFATRVPASKGVPQGWATAEPLGTSPCADVLVFGAGKGRAVVSVLASNGQPRWSVGRAAGDQHAGTVTRPSRPPAPRC